MDHIKLMSSDGECELNIVRNYLNQGRPGFIVRYADEEGVAVSRELPLAPEALIEIVRMLMEAEHYMLKFLAVHMVANGPTPEALIEKAAQDADSNLITFKRKD